MQLYVLSIKFKTISFVGVIFAFKNYNQDVIQDLGAPYDYGKTVHSNKKQSNNELLRPEGSVMHYGNYAFAFDPLVPTIYPRHEGVEIGQRRGFSEVTNKPFT